MFSIRGDLVVDPFLGSGTSLKAAMDLERRFVGYERLDELIGIIKSRIGALVDKVYFEKQVSPVVELVI